jgi:hypothetical protein
MVIKRRSLQAAALPLVAISSLIVLNSCNDADEMNPNSNNDLIIGDWQVTEIDGESYTSEDYSIQFKFKASGDLDFCVDINYGGITIGDCYNWQWKWEDTAYTTLIITDDENIEETADVVQLDENNLELEITYEEYGTTYTSNFKFVKIN